MARYGEVERRGLSLDFRRTYCLRCHAYFCVRSTAYYTQHGENRAHSYHLRVKESYHRAVQRTTAKLAAVHRQSSYHFTTRRITTAKLAVVPRRVPCLSETTTPHHDVVSRGLSTVGLDTEMFRNFSNAA
ncbi:hypothetical protein TREMEDRAFT_63254 [Tremella mesenterica DSM 1558]|uniref:uncharacterized protein n=1 Tax=Tremella mesenterica (strain ATCC 24925 / CBS 8224 / DSM 1558 / NBRC 9311 / NRRL Y-6157 / RJB 2259-6 / UBC 559-6) TaxID=578456 RepID=UPI0003F48DE0|nr:uncharacterized protein TREMEDRAFT_63254 [Tremella mesenterica DSM 1558]EIW68791.1 hypothetical protein TREMEDRAFT_63254 [Tremella mesenterica DSM 1558]